MTLDEELVELRHDLERSKEDCDELRERIEHAESVTGRSEIVHETMRVLGITYRGEHGPWRTVSSFHRWRRYEAVRMAVNRGFAPKNGQDL